MENNSQITLELQNINKIYDGIKILDNISLQIQRGEILSLIGSSGAGKSTLLKCMNLLTIPTEGKIIISGEEIKLKINKITKEQELLKEDQIINIRKKVGFVFQNFNLWNHRTILENITEAPIYVLNKSKQEAEEIATYWLNRVNLYHKKNAYPYELSGGQQQRIAIARALSMSPPILLMDEPTSALDPENVKDAVSFIKSLAEDGTTIVLVTHEMSFCKVISKRIAFLDAGKIEAIGSVDEIFKNPQSKRLELFLSHFLNSN
jgi:polar amino acid transport system ATP-binding protein